jgi:NADH-quinone oxidoreductase subunit M
MSLLAFLVVPLLGALASVAAGRRSKELPRWIALGALALPLGLALALWLRPAEMGAGRWLEELDWNWLPGLGIHLHLAVDGLSLVLLVLTYFLGMVAVLASWTEIEERVGFFHFNLLLVLTGVAGVFLALDLFLFYFAWELMLVPMYLLIALWGHERRLYAAVKFFLFTQLSGLFMLLAIVGLAFAHRQNTGTLSFQYEDLLGTSLSPTDERWIMLGFLAAFLVKLPAVPFHTWLPDAHTEAPTAGSVVLAGLLLKTGAYGILRFAVPLLPASAATFAPLAMVLGVTGVLYGALMAFAQTDVKRLVAYTSVSHMGFVLLGVFGGNPLAQQGAVVQMVAHGLSTGALFVAVGVLQQRLHTRELANMGGLWSVMPGLGGLSLLFVLGSLGLPGLGDFVGEFLVLLGTYAVSPTAAVLGALGMILAMVYGLQLVARTFHGDNVLHWRVRDLGARETVVLGCLAATLLALGLYPQPVLDASRLHQASAPSVFADKEIAR